MPPRPTREITQVMSSRSGLLLALTASSQRGVGITAQVFHYSRPPVPLDGQGAPATGSLAASCVEAGLYAKAVQEARMFDPRVLSERRLEHHVSRICFGMISVTYADAGQKCASMWVCVPCACGVDFDVRSSSTRSQSQTRTGVYMARRSAWRNHPPIHVGSAGLP